MSPPLLINLAAHRPSWFLYGTAAALGILLLVFLLVRFVPDEHSPENDSHEVESPVWRLRILPVICALFFIYVGAETAFGGWVATYAHRIGTADSTFWTMTPAFFYGAILAGRTLAPLALRRLRERAVAQLGLTLALLGAIALLAAHSILFVIPGAFLAGLGLASIFPISVSLFPRCFPEDSLPASGAVFASDNL